MKILWTRESLNRLIEIEEFIAKDNAERAVQFVDEIIAHAESLLPGEPRIGEWFPKYPIPLCGNCCLKNIELSTG